ncbi:MAG: tRNA (adenosine(37)-N6)-threonylcarbamoyltransferase complex transferase subunit TsaD [Chitinophagaceae bacterium]
MSITLLAIESSCDETSASILKDGNIYSNVIYTQKIHEQYGGVIPESASRLHSQHILPVVEEAYKQSGILKHQVDAVAYTQSPGLIGSLMVGACFAKSYAYALGIPTIAVHHMQAHVLANLIEDPKPSFPFLCLTVSGGHTQIVQVNSPIDMNVLGETIDDAAGEAFDKAAKMLKLPYPGGPQIDQLAAKGNPNAFAFAKPQIPDLNFSFSGLKTSILYFLQKQDDEFISQHLADLCASIQATIIDILMKKLKKAVIQTGIKQVCIAGGVSANKGLRLALQDFSQRHGWTYYIPSFEYCTDNAGMIAMAAYYKFLNQDFANWETTPSARSAF